MKAVVWKNFSFLYRGEADDALHDINLAIEPGQFVAVVGASGAGKSTLSFTLNGLIPHFQKGRLTGTVTVFGKDVQQKKVNDMAQDVGLVFQDFESQLFSTNVKLEVAFGPENFELPWQEIDERVKAWLQNVGLEEFQDRDPSSLSGGQKQRLAIASVLALKPKLLSLDEPTTDLDPEGKDHIFRIAHQLKRETDMTIIMAEHETERIMGAADRVVVLDRGQIVMDGTPADVFSQTEQLRQWGIAPLQGVELLEEIGAPLPEQLTEEHLLETLDQAAPRIDEAQYKKLLDGDSAYVQSLGEPLVEVKELTHVYSGAPPGTPPAVDRVSLDIQKGDFVAVLGQNGSGKTTLVKHFNGLLKPTAGTVSFRKKTTEDTSIYELGQHIGYVFQNPDHQIFAETVFDEVAFGCRMQRLPEEELNVRVADALEAVSLSGYEERDPFSLTKGERQRVAVASVLSLKPEVLIFDEPTTGLDYRQQRSMMGLIQKLNEEGHTVIMVTHQMDIVAEYAKRVIVMKDGKLLLQGRTREVFAQEDVLKQAHLDVPFVTRWSNRLQKTLLSVAEAKRVFVKEA